MAARGSCSMRCRPSGTACSSTCTWTPPGAGPGGEAPEGLSAVRCDVTDAESVEAAFAEVESQGISYTAGVPPVAAATPSNPQPTSGASSAEAASRPGVRLSPKARWKPWGPWSLRTWTTWTTALRQPVHSSGIVEIVLTDASSTSSVTYRIETSRNLSLRQAAGQLDLVDSGGHVGVAERRRRCGSLGGGRRRPAGGGEGQRG